MEKQDIGTVGGKPITQEILENFEATFERDWFDSEVSVSPTERGRVFRALHDLKIPAYEIEALERKANRKQQPLISYIHSIIEQELFVSND